MQSMTGRHTFSVLTSVSGLGCRVRYTEFREEMLLAQGEAMLDQYSNDRRVFGVLGLAGL